MDPKVKMRLGWVQFYEKTDNFSLTSRRCGISWPTLRKWVSPYQESRLEELLDRSRRPKHCRSDKTSTSSVESMNAQNRLWIGQLRQRRLGSRRMQSELLPLQQVSLSTATIHKILKLEGHALLKSTRRSRKGFKRYQKEIPGERVQTVGELVEPWMCAKLALRSVSLPPLMTVLA